MEISSVKLRNTYQSFFIDTNHIFVNQNALCVVETEHGVDIGNVIKSSFYSKRNDIEIKGKILRKATHEDISQINELEEIETKAFEACKEKAGQKNLEMKLISTKCLLDKTKIIFYFVAESRIDFRELVRELASIFRTRIEMRQIGVRDEARLVGGFGPCGRPQCCLHHREDFDPVSIKMAKEQHLNLNSLKISGMCGRLLCCLSYEYETYLEHNRELPHEGTEITAGDAIYRVMALDPLQGKLVLYDDDRMIELYRKDIIFEEGRYQVTGEALARINRSGEDNQDNEETEEIERLI